MHRPSIHGLALALASAGLSVVLTGSAMAAGPGGDAPVHASHARVDQTCAVATQAVAEAERTATRARAAARRAARKVVRAKRVLDRVRQRLAQSPSATNRKRLIRAKSAKRRAVVQRKVTVRTSTRAKQRLVTQRAKLATCRAALPRVTGPITGGEHGYPGTASNQDLASHGYTETEYFLEGTATKYARNGAWTSDGRWGVRADGTARYRTRLLVRAPESPRAFNGTVLVEWLNVSGNSDAEVAFPYMYNELVREGYAWVGVSAQAVGVNAVSDPNNTVGANVVGLKAWDPERYGSLVHPGDAYSFDIFSQAGRALTDATGVSPLRGLKVNHLIAAGQSQSGYRMLTYANAVQPVADVYDGLFVYARGGVGSPLGERTSVEPQGPEGPDLPSPARVRTDLDVPVMQLQSETELFETGGGPAPTQFYAARQPDTDLIRTWEMAGTAHSDKYLVTLMNAMYQRQFVGARDLSPVLSLINDGPQRYLASAALRSMRTWITDGVAPASAPPITIEDGAIQRDEFGNALGGVRSPQLDVPTAILSGERQLVPLNGFTTRFSATRLHEIYGSNASYVQQFTAAANRAADDGFLLPEDAEALIAEAAASGIGNPVG